jgi:hypothetical protein
MPTKIIVLKLNVRSERKIYANFCETEHVATVSKIFIHAAQFFQN